MKPGLTPVEGIIFCLCLVAAAHRAAGWLDAPGYNRCGTDRTGAALSQLSMAVETFHVHTGRYPERLDDLVARPLDLDSWKGPYLRQVDVDRWNRPYIYRVPAAGGARCEVGTLGADGLPGGRGGDADVWSPTRE